MRIAIIIALLCWSVCGKAQATGKDINRENGKYKLEAIAQNTQRYVGVYSAPGLQSQLEKQKQTWRVLTVTLPQNAKNWLNYYVSSKLYYQQKDKNQLSNQSKESLRQIAEKMDKEASTSFEKSFEKQLVRYYETKENNYKQAKQYLEAAYKLNPKNSLLYSEMALYYEVEGKTTERNAMCDKINNIASNTAIYKFSLAQLKTLPKNSIIITNGEFDTYALWKAANKLNKKVTVISYGLLKNSFYRNRVFKSGALKHPSYNSRKHNSYLAKLLKANKSKSTIYLSSTLDKKYLKSIDSKLYHTGYAYQYSNSPINTTQTLYKNLMGVKDSDFINSSQNQLLKNIMPAYIILYRQYKTSDAEVAKSVYYKAKTFAQRMGFWGAEYEQYFK